MFPVSFLNKSEIKALQTLESEAYSNSCNEVFWKKYIKIRIYLLSINVIDAGSTCFHDVLFQYYLPMFYKHEIRKYAQSCNTHLVWMQKKKKCPVFIHILNDKNVVRLMIKIKIWFKKFALPSPQSVFTSSLVFSDMQILKFSIKIRSADQA